MDEGDPRVERVARALCTLSGRDPDSREPGNVTVPWNADYIGEDNIRWDGLSGSEGDLYREHWVFMWRRFVPQAMTALLALAAE